MIGETKMKLRIAHIDTSDRMAGVFAVQSSFLGILWDDMYFDPNKGKLQEEFTLGSAEIVGACFEDFHEAMRYARAYKKCSKRIIRETWKV
jgi:hypothetical protein